MKTTFKIFTVLLAVLSLASCKKYLDVNENPNSPTTPPINGLLTRVTQSTALNMQRVANITSYYTQYLASPNPSSPTDVYEPIDASTTWNFIYDNMTDIYDLQEMAAEQGATQYLGVAKILMAMNMQHLHSLWGAAPFSQAFSGQNLAPAYDDAQALFQRNLQLLDEAVTHLQAPGSTRLIPMASGTANKTDLIHNGSTDAWIRTAYALKARLLNRLSKTAQYNPATIFDALSKSYTSNAHDAFVNTFSVRNPWNQVAVDNAALVLDGWLSQYYVNLMNGTSIPTLVDPRLPLTASLTRLNEYKGTRNGAGRAAGSSGTNKDESYISLTGTLSSTNAPLYLISFDELKFIEAEVALRSNDRPRAYAAYLAAINANMVRMNADPGTASTYLAHPTVAVGAANLSLTDIFREKYKALFLQPETWVDLRRIDYQLPGFQLPLNAVTNTYVRRLVYPSVETSRNAANVPNVTDVTQKLWWDQ